MAKVENKMKKFDNEIKADKHWYDINFKELIAYKDLILLFVYRNITLTYKQTILGPAWIIITPLVTSIIFTFIFGNLAGISTDGIPSIIFYLSGTAMWSFFSTTFQTSAKTFVANAGVLGKVYFPRLTLPISNALNSFFNFMLQLTLIILLYLFYLLKGVNLHITIYLIFFPIVILQLSMLSIGLGILVSSLTTKYRDLAIAVDFGVQLWMYLTPVVYPASTATGIMKLIVLLNPVTMPLEIFRLGLFGIGTYNLYSWIWSLLFSFFSIVIGILLFNKIESTFMDTV